MMLSSCTSVVVNGSRRSCVLQSTLSRIGVPMRSPLIVRNVHLFTPSSLVTSASIHNKVQHPITGLWNSHRAYTTTSSSDILAHIANQVKSDECVVYMKGTADEPRCGYSRAVIQVLRMHGAKFKTYDVLSDETLRNAIKEYSNWPTLPQVYLKGEFVGGCDIMLSLHKSGELETMLKDAGVVEKAEE